MYMYFGNKYIFYCKRLIIINKQLQATIKASETDCAVAGNKRKYVPELIYLNTFLLLSQPICKLCQEHPNILVLTGYGFHI